MGPHTYIASELRQVHLRRPRHTSLYTRYISQPAHSTPKLAPKDSQSATCAATPPWPVLRSGDTQVYLSHAYMGPMCVGGAWGVRHPGESKKTKSALLRRF